MKGSLFCIWQYFYYYCDLIQMQLHNKTYLLWMTLHMGVEYFSLSCSLIAYVQWITKCTQHILCISSNFLYIVCYITSSSYLLNIPSVALFAIFFKLIYTYINVNSLFVQCNLQNSFHKRFMTLQWLIWLYQILFSKINRLNLFYVPVSIKIKPCTFKKQPATFMKYSFQLPVTKRKLILSNWR